MIAKSPWTGRLGAACMVLAATAAGAEPLTLDRLLKLEDLGATALAPGGRYLVIETRAPYDQAPGFDFETPDARIGRLMVVDRVKGGGPRALLSADQRSGYTAGPFSPDGHRMIVSRWREGRWTTGVVELASGAVRWFDFGLESPEYGRSLQWLSDTAFIAIGRDPEDLPLKLKLGSQNQARLSALWRRQAEGRIAAITVVGSGRARRPEPLGNRRLLKVDAVTGVSKALATGGFFDIELSPSGRYLAALEEAERIDLVDRPAVRMMAPSRRRALSVVDLRTGAVEAICATCTTLIEPMVWSPGADRLLVFQHAADRPETEGALVVVDPARRQVEAMTAAPQPDIDYGSEGAARVRADWMGSHPILLGRPATAARSDWYDLSGTTPVNLTSVLPSGGASLAFDMAGGTFALSQGQTWRLDGAGGAVKQPATGSAWFRPGMFGLGVRPASAPWRAADLRLRTETGLSDLRGRPLALPQSARPLAVIGEETIVERRPPSGVAGIEVVEPSGARKTLLAVNSDLANVEFGAVRTVETRAWNGQILKSWIYLPPGWRPGRKPPLVVIPYPGSAPQSFPFRFTVRTGLLTPSAVLLAAQGYAVLIPALPRDRGRGEPGEDLAQQILAAVDAVVDQGLADPDRLALWGHSFGGYAGLVTATQTHRFKAIIAQAGPSDFVANWASTDPYFFTAPEDGAPSPNMLGFNETGQGGLKGPPWRETERYLRNSPLFQADKISTPMMLVYGEQDFVALAQGQAMFNALYRQGKDATLLTMFGERHLPASPATIRALYAEVLPWLADRLAAPAPGPAAASKSAIRPSQ